mmetsp:Transcript_95547/g.117039  ORF Transcript_95547/g.117039 Transcript_95547/m.117039 type:complete len:80 (+) Transcript_95547:223-462(+)
MRHFAMELEGCRQRSPSLYNSPVGHQDRSEGGRDAWRLPCRLGNAGGWILMVIRMIVKAVVVQLAKQKPTCAPTGRKIV